MPAEIVHLCPYTGQHFTPCCGRTPFELLAHRMTTDMALVTCPGIRNLAVRFRVSFSVTQALVADEQATAFFGENMWREILALRGGTPTADPGLEITTEVDVHDIIFLNIVGYAFRNAPEPEPEPDDDEDDYWSDWVDAMAWRPEEGKIL